jgi:hypothetical protein
MPMVGAVFAVEAATGASSSPSVDGDCSRAADDQRGGQDPADAVLHGVRSLRVEGASSSPAEAGGRMDRIVMGGAFADECGGLARIEP